MTSSIRAGYDTRSYTLTANVQQSLPSAREFLIISASVDITAIGFNLGDNNGDFEVWPFGFAIGVTEGSIKARIQSSVTQTVVIAMIDGIATVKDNRFAPGAGSLPVTEADGANIALGARADAAATTDGGTFSLIALMKRLLSKVGPVTSVDGGLVSLGTTTDASAPADNSNVSLIALMKRLLSKTGVTTTSVFNQNYARNQGAGVVLNTAALVAPGSNINGISIYSAFLAPRADPRALITIFDPTSGNAFLETFDSCPLTLGAPFIIPAGIGLSVSITGGGSVGITFRIL